MPKLEYRSLRFEEEWVPEPDEQFFQEAMVRALRACNPAVLRPCSPAAPQPCSPAALQPGNPATRPLQPLPARSPYVAIDMRTHPVGCLPPPGGQLPVARRALHAHRRVQARAQPVGGRQGA